MNERNLTEQDVEAIIDAFESRFYRNLGKGLWDVVWKALVAILIGLAAWGSYHK